ncbi:efflux RND transporter periplasmic adaptor subunit [Mongoliitalea lutea]|uniref:ABC transporter permease n=1 Tax=Mongoliitalea lutea TaxID=849756 RepID=A0A8J3CV90_9BACT|nr:HlyD family efflux transporter periplasmic adaptor subunit [Mongoliitalea lutea]GHB24307.1 ABC transporter permease [Mongoliitalea lutea]
MDRKLEKKFWTTGRIVLVISSVLVVGLIGWQLWGVDHRSSMNVSMERVTLATVKEGEFTDYIPVSGTIEPGEVFFLDALEGGNIQQIIRESGAFVNQGDTILILSNSKLQLEVMERESGLYFQLNNLRQVRLQLDQNDLSQQAQLAEIDYQISLFKPQFERFKELHSKRLVSEREFEEVREQYEYNVKRRRLTYEAYRNDSISRVVQKKQLQDSERRMNQSLNGVGHILDNLALRAPISGQLSTEPIQVGQSISPGQRFGQIDILDKFKVRVPIDELYLSRVYMGLKGTFTFSGETHELEIAKVYPTVTGGRFEVDMIFTGEIPTGIRRGQTVRIRLELGESEQALLVSSGGFYKDTGGNWVFVFNPSTGKAEKRTIRLGRKNPEFYEVIEGLQAGEKVIVSGYEGFGKNEVLYLK